MADIGEALCQKSPFEMTEAAGGLGVTSLGSLFQTKPVGDQVFQARARFLNQNGRERGVTHAQAGIQYIFIEMQQVFLCTVLSNKVEPERVRLSLETRSTSAPHSAADRAARIPAAPPPITSTSVSITCMLSA